MSPREYCASKGWKVKLAIEPAGYAIVVREDALPSIIVKEGFQTKQEAEKFITELRQNPVL